MQDTSRPSAEDASVFEVANSGSDTEASSSYHSATSIQPTTEPETTIGMCSSLNGRLSILRFYPRM